MTPEQLRRLAAQRVAEAAELQVDATGLRCRVGALKGLLDSLVPMSNRVWQGPAADDFENQLRIHAGRVNEQAQVLDAVAADFDRIAGQKQREAVRLRAQAAAIEVVTAPGAVM